MDPVDPQPTRLLQGAYVAAHYGKSLFWYATELLFAFYLAEVYRLDPAGIGGLLFIFLVWDAVTDPMIGLVLAGRRIRTVDLVRLQLAGAVLSALAFIAIFLKPDLPPAALFAYAAGVGLVFRTAYTIYDVPQNTLLARLGGNERGRLTLSSLRAAFSAVAALTLSLATVLVLSETGERQAALPFAVMALAFVTIALVTALVLWRAGRGLCDDTPGAAASGPAVSDVAGTFAQPWVVRCLLAVFVLSIGWPLFGKLLPFFATYVLGNSQSAGPLIAATAIGAAVSQPAWIVLDRHIGRDAMLTLAFCGLLAGSALFAAFAADGVWSAALVTGLLSACASAMGMLVWARLADQFAPAQGRSTNDVLAFGALTFAAKLALGVGGLGLGLTLEVIGYRAGAPLGPEGQWALACIMAAGPAACAALAWLFVIRAFPSRPIGQAIKAPIAER